MGKRGRKSTEQDADKLSPPAKMNQRSDAKLDEILTKLDSLELRFVRLENEVANMSKVLSELEITRKEVAEVKEAVEGFKRVELEIKRRSVLVRGIPFQTDGKFETRMQTRGVLANLFNRLGMAPTLVDYHRLGGIRQGENGSKVSIRVLFVDVDQKFELFEKLKEKGNDLKDVSILTDYPSFQMQEFKALSTQAYNIRQAQPGTKTRIVPKGLGLALQRRAGDKWIPVSG